MIGKITRTSLNPAIQRFIKRKEEALNRTCRSIDEHTNHKGEKYLFASFCKNYDKLIITIGYYDRGIHRFITPR